MKMMMKKKKGPHMVNLDAFRFSDSESEGEGNEVNSSYDSPSSEEDDDETNHTGDRDMGHDETFKSGHDNDLRPRKWKQAKRLEEKYDIENQFRVSLFAHDDSDEKESEELNKRDKGNTRTEGHKVIDPLGITVHIPYHQHRDPASDAFNARQFLSSVHEDVSFRALCKGSENLKLIQEEQNKKLKKLVQDNFGRFISGIDKINDLFITSGDALFNSDDLDTLEQRFAGLLRESDELFDPMIEKRERAEKIRQTLSLLKRLQFTLMIPSDIKLNIANGEFRKVVNEYRRAKFFSKRLEKSEMFQIVYREVLRVISEFRETLFCQLADWTVPIEEQERTIGYLNVLDSDRDPSWFYLCTQHEHIINLIETCTVENDSSNAFPSHALNLIQHLGTILLEHAPIYTRLSKNIQVENKKKRRSQQETTRWELMIMFEKLINAYARRCRQVLKDEDEGHSQQPWLIECLAEIVTCAEKVTRGLTAEHEVIFTASIIDFAEEMKQFAMVEMWRRLNNEIGKIYALEDYLLERETSHTKLPALLEQKVQVMIRNVSQFMDLSSNIGNVNDEPLSEQLVIELVRGLLAFADSLHELVFPSSMLNVTQSAINKDDIITVHPFLGSIGSEIWQRRMLIVLSNCRFMKDVCLKRIITTFASNIMTKNASPEMGRSPKQTSSHREDERENTPHTSRRKEHSLARAIAKQLLSTPELKQVFQVYDTLEGLLLRAFLCERSRKMGVIVGSTFPLNARHWKQIGAPTAVRTEVIELLLEIALTHFHCESITGRYYTRQILGDMVEKIAELMGEFVDNVDSINSNLALQLEIDIAFIEESLSEFLTHRGRRIFADIVSRIHPMVQSFNADRMKTKVIAKAREWTRNQLSAFYHSENQ